MIKASLRKLRYVTFGFLVLLLVFSVVTPVLAVGLGHGFFGTVTLAGEDAPAGTVIVARVGGTTYGSTTITTAGSYGLLVQGDIEEEATIYFYVDGEEADQTFEYHDGWTTELDLTVTGPAVPKYGLTMAQDPVSGGNATDETGTSPYEEGTVVEIKAVPASGYGFVNWTAPAGTFGNATAENTTFTMPAEDVTVTANFALTYELTMAEDPAGTGEAVDVDGRGSYAAGATVMIRAAPATGYGFVEWTAVPEVTFDSTTDEETTFVMPAANVTVTASFAVAYGLTMAEDPAGGGDALDVDGKGAYAEGATVSIKAVPAAGYQFVDWMASPAVTFGDAAAEETTFTMPAQAVTVTANFQAVYALSMARDPAEGGRAVDVDGKGAYPEGATVSIEAVPAAGYQFVNWTAPPAVTFDDATAEETTFTMPAQSITVIANFEVLEGAPTVTTAAASGITTYSADLNMTFTTGSYSSVEVRFAVKRPTDPAWFHTPWASKTSDGTYTYPLTGLAPQTDYEFKAQLKYDDTVMEGAIGQFTTATQPGAGLGFDLSAFGCFIATAAYGTPAAQQIDVLREFRDAVLMQSRLGSWLVALYYRTSPPIAEVIAGSGFVRSLVREVLIDPIVWTVEVTGDLWRR
ncbi:MAG: InlB B-repeat-containing protein [Dehalococcoidia bacterium]